MKCNDNVLPMVAPGKSLVDIMLTDGQLEVAKVSRLQG